MTEFAATTHPGLKRNHNEDCFEADPELGLWLVADGVGGHSFGEVASALVKTTVAKTYATGESLSESVRKAHLAVVEELGDRKEALGMGSTVVALAIKGQDYEIAWVGDSRAYLWDGENIQQLTRDHTHVSDLVDGGVISKTEAASHPERHVLTQSIGIFADMELKPGLISGKISPGQQFLLCSDGLTDELTDPAIAGQLRRNTTPQTQVDSLLNSALAAGGKDNVTVVVVGKASDSNPHPTHTPGLDLETTQNISHAVRSTPPARVNHSRKFWLTLAALVVAAAIGWLLIN
ncbi:MAG: protein phosphatase 2C domain-containing protein [Halioglobus sp.]